MSIEMNAIDEAIVKRCGFEVTIVGDRYCVRDPSNRKLGKGGRLEGGNLTALLSQAEDAHLNAKQSKSLAGFVASRKPKAGSGTAASKQAAPSASDASVEPKPKAARVARVKPARPARDMSAMNAVYEAVINGMEPSEVYKTLSAKGFKFQSDGSVYTHAAIGKRVMERARHLGWKGPVKDAE